MVIVTTVIGTLRVGQWPLRRGRLRYGGAVTMVETAERGAMAQEMARDEDTGADEAAELTGALRALADPTRLRIYQELRRGEACVCELAGSLGLAENLVSHHLGALRRARLVVDRRDASDARWVYYQLDTATLGRLFAGVGALFDVRTLGARTPTCGPAALTMAGVVTGTASAPVTLSPRRSGGGGGRGRAARQGDDTTGG